MAARHSFDLLRAGLSADAQARAGALTDEMDRTQTLGELRRARAMTQERLAANLHVNQASIARIERRNDMYLSTLRRVVGAMGGELEIVARFPGERPVRLVGIGEVEDVGKGEEAT